jgi:large subunit ribosomal protein L25
MSNETIEVKRREGSGTRDARKLRSVGRVPAILYGHGEENVPLTVNAAAISRIIHQGTKMLSLTGAVSDTALVRDVQWDAFGMDVLHVDFARVSGAEAVEVTLPVEVQGVAPGSSEGGVLSVVAHELTILCPASRIPEQLQVNVGELHVGQAIHAGEVPLPEGASVVGAESEVVVQVNKAQVEEEEPIEVSEGSEAEPEVISKGKSDEEESS